MQTVNQSDPLNHQLANISRYSQPCHRRAFVPRRLGGGVERSEGEDGKFAVEGPLDFGWISAIAPLGLAAVDEQ